MQERLRMLIAEDNDIQRQAVVQLANDLPFDIDVVQAQNGPEALAALQSGRFDILFTDIKMPHMNGLELAERAKALCPDLQIVVFSAFDEFQFAQKAVELGIYQYLLKPIAVDAFCALMQDLADRCRTLRHHRVHQRTLEEHSRLHQASLRERALYDLIQGLVPAQEGLRLLQAAPPFSLPSAKRLVLAVLSGDDLIAREEELQRWFQATGAFGIMLEACQCVFAIEDDQQVDRRAQAFATAFGGPECHVCLGISLPFRQLDALPGLFARLEQLVEKRFFYEGDSVLYDEPLPGASSTGTAGAEMDIHALPGEVSTLLLEGRFELAGQKINAFFLDPGLAEFSHNQVQYLGCRLAELLSRHEPRLASVSYIDQINAMGSAQHIREFLLGSLMSIRDQAYESRDSQLIGQVIALIRDHYEENIGLEWLADSVGFSSGYLSTHFRQKMGVTLSHYLAQHRVNQAIQLLQNTDLRVQDIAVKAGYPNYPYFCTLFKKYTGMTPQQCRLKKEDAR